MSSSDEGKKNKSNEDVESGPPQGEGTTAAPTSDMMKDMMVVDESAIGYAGIFFSGMILLIALTNKGGAKSNKYYEYGIAVAVVAMFFSITGFVMRNNKAAMSLNTFLAIWSFVGAGFMTFDKGPFRTVGNGFFGSWGMVIFSVTSLGASADAMQGNKPTGLGAMIGLTASAIVLTSAICVEGIDKTDERFAELVYGICLGILTILVMGGLVKGEMGSGAPKLKFPLLAFFAVNWVTSANLLTFRGPFTQVGNGYFSAWAGGITSLFALIGCWKGMKQKDA